MADINITGIRWPLRFHAGRVMLSNNDQHIAESIKQIIAINFFEYISRPTFGANLRPRIFDTTNAAALLTHDVSRALRLWEPRVEVAKISLNIDRAGEGVVYLLVQYRRAGNLGQIQVDMSNIYLGGGFSQGGPADPATAPAQIGQPEL